jgi:integrase
VDSTQVIPNIGPGLGGESEKSMRFPMRLRHNGKGRVLVTLYKRDGGYRAYWRSRGLDGKARSEQKEFRFYVEAKDFADEKVKKLAAAAKGRLVSGLAEGEASDARAALGVLQRFYEDTGERLKLNDVAVRYCDAARKLGKTPVHDAIDGFLSNVAVVKRKPLVEAVTEFLEGRKHLAESKDGARPKHSPVYEANVAMWLNQFAGTLPGHTVLDIGKKHLDIYMGSFSGLSPKSRNDRRAIVKQLLRWCAAKDYLAQNHRLFEAVSFKTEDVDISEIDFYRPKELRLMLDAASVELLPVVALGGLAGIRREEIMRVEWADVWRVPGKVEIGARIAKGRKRRLVSICPALNAWLRPYRKASGRVWSKSPDTLEEGLAELRDGAGVPARRNGLRHAFITFHMAAHSNENLTAAECGNSPQMIHEHYRALATAAEAKRWFGTNPAKARGNVIDLPTNTATK